MGENFICKICGRDKTGRLYDKGTYNIIRCRSCGFIFNDKWESFSDKERYAPEKSTDIKALKEIFEREKEIYFDRFKNDLKEIAKLKSPGRILDIGCGPGYFLFLAKSQGWEAFGIDIDNGMVEFCKQYLSLKVSQGSLGRASYPESYFDAITLFHVLEHVPDFDLTISNACKMLKPDGLLVIDVPNAGDIRRSLFKGDWMQFREHHLWYFSEHALEMLLRKHGFKIEKRVFHGGSQVVASLNKTMKVNLRWTIDKYYRYLRPIRGSILFLLNHLGFSEDISVYARKIK
jgi:2-polyprenyl-3-methyl-5-hydroxy-6-metoxy-1,4-benzoquinol methylase